MVDTDMLTTQLGIKNIDNTNKPAINGLMIASYINVNDLTLNVITHRATILETATYLKLNSVYVVNSPIDCYVVDRPEYNFRFTVIYNLQSFNNNSRVQLVAKTDGLLPMVSLQSIFPAYNWAEREAWDMSGIFFIKHPDLRRILTDYGFIGHPLRKDYPLSGFRELHYEDSRRRIEYDVLELSQNYRVSNLIGPWIRAKKI